MAVVWSGTGLELVWDGLMLVSVCLVVGYLLLRPRR